MHFQVTSTFAQGMPELLSPQTDLVDSFTQWNYNVQNALMTIGIHYSTFAIPPPGILLSATVSLTNLHIRREGKIKKGVNKRTKPMSFMQQICNQGHSTLPICLVMIAKRRLWGWKTTWALYTYKDVLIRSCNRNVSKRQFVGKQIYQGFALKSLSTNFNHL